GEVRRISLRLPGKRRTRSAAEAGPVDGDRLVPRAEPLLQGAHLAARGDRAQSRQQQDERPLTAAIEAEIDRPPVPIPHDLPGLHDMILRFRSPFETRVARHARGVLSSRIRRLPPTGGRPWLRSHSTSTADRARSRSTIRICPYSTRCATTLR